MSETDLAAARDHARAAFTDLANTLRELQERLRLSSLASDAFAELKRKGADAAGEAVNAVRSRPVAASAAAAGLAALLGARLYLDRSKDPKGDRS